jgi:hypothetical protein
MKKLMLIFLVVLTSLCGCQLQKVMINVYTPSKLAYPPYLKAIMVTSRYVPATGPYEDIMWGAYESVDSLKWALSESVVDTLGKRMATGNVYLVKAKHLLHILRHNEANFPDPVAWDGLLNLAKKEFVQAILIIEGFGLEKTPVIVSEDNGNYLAHYSMDVTLAIRVYEPDKRRMIDDSLYTFSTEFKGYGKTELEARKELPDERKASFTACSNAADGYFSLIKPGAILEKRFYFNKGDSLMVQADQAIRQGKWGRAEAKWKWLAYNNQDSIIQAKASFNMAMVCEREGLINQALGYAKRSQRLYPTKHTLAYIDMLNKKSEEYEDQVKQKKIIKRW